MDKDDRMVGRVLSRREVLALLGVAATSLLAACAPTSSGTAQPALVSTQAPENTETPAPSDTAGAATAECPAARLFRARLGADSVHGLRAQQRETPLRDGRRLSRGARV